MRFAPYDQIAGEYYDSFHKTCRNFDQTTLKAIEPIRPRIPQDGLILDIGCGRGRCVEFLNVEADRVIQLDNSRAMLEISPRENCLLQVLHDAEELPFLACSFACVTSFLCDPFLGLNFLAETYRVLESGGLFLATTSTLEWGTALRDEIGIDCSETRFKTRAGNEIHVPSILVSTDRLVSMLMRTGFDDKKIQIQRHRLPNDADPVSSDVTTSANQLKCGVHDIDLINMIIAVK